MRRVLFILLAFVLVLSSGLVTAVPALAQELPTVTTQAATNVGTDLATLNMAYDFKDDGSGYVQFAYKPSGGNYVYTNWVAKTASGTYSEAISGLSPNTTYYFKARLKDTTEIEGDELSFITSKAIPVVTTQVATNVGTTSATLIMAYDFKDYVSGYVQFAYKPSGGNYVYTNWVAKTGSGTYSEAISGLSPNTTYYFKARLKYDTTEIEGTELSFITLKAIPVVTTQAATYVGTTSAILNMAYDFKDYGSGYVQFAFKPSGGDYTYTDWVAKAGSGTYSEAISGYFFGVSSNTTYYFKARLKYDTTEIEGTELSFTTLKATPTVTTRAATKLGTDSAILRMFYSFKDYGAGAVQFAYKPSGGDYTYTDWVAVTGLATHSKIISGVGPDTTYYFKARLKYDTTEIEGAELSFTTTRAITVIYPNGGPNGGETWAVGTTQMIHWSSAGVTGSVRILLSRDGGLTWKKIKSSTRNDGSWAWKVKGPATAQAMIKVVSRRDRTVFDTSDAYFTIAQSIAVISPNGGESSGREIWAAGTKQIIRWSSAGVPGKVRILLSRDGGLTWKKIKSRTQNDGSWVWKVKGPATVQAMIMVVSRRDRTVFDTSDAYFTIARSIAVVSPNGGEIRAAGTTQMIRWSSVGVSGRVRILLSRDGGLTWKKIKSSTRNDGSWAWKVKGPATTQAMIKVVSRRDRTVFDTSDAYFTINP